MTSSGRQEAVHLEESARRDPVALVADGVSQAGRAGGGENLAQAQGTPGGQDGGGGRKLREGFAKRSDRALENGGCGLWGRCGGAQEGDLQVGKVVVGEELDLTR